MMAIKGISFPEKSIPLEVAIVDGFRHMFITCTNGFIYVFKFKFYSYTKIEIELVDKVDLKNEVVSYSSRKVRKFSKFDTHGFNSKRIIENFKKNSNSIMNRRRRLRSKWEKKLNQDSKIRSLTKIDQK
jgi:hypothetical protein